MQTVESPRGIAAAVAAKNMPLACFINAATGLEEIVFTISFLSSRMAAGAFSL